MKMKNKINIALYKDAEREMFIECKDEKMYVYHSNKEGTEEHATEYSFETFLLTFTVMQEFFKELCATNDELLLKMSKISKKAGNIKYDYV